MTTKEVAQICGVTEKTVRENAKTFGKVFENGKPTEWSEEELKKVQLVLMKNQMSQGTETNGGAVESTVESYFQSGLTIQEIINSGNIEAAAVSDIDDFKYSKEDICNICNVSSKTLERFLAETSMSQRDFISIGSSHKKLYNDDVLKKFQLWLMNNQVNQGVQVETVKSNLETDFQVGLTFQEIVNSGNVEAMKELTTFAMNACAEVARNKQLEAQNKLLLEQKEKAEAETARIYQYNKNFHSNLYTASDISKKFGITPNMVGRIANENGLKQDPIYGKLGKIQLNNGKWVNQFYYNEDALTVIKSMVRKSANIIK